MVKETKAKKTKKAATKPVKKAAAKKSAPKKAAAKKSAAKKAAVEKRTAPPGAYVADYGIILSPVITEKSSLVGGDRRHVVFRVAPRANKTEIREAVERIFKVEVAKVRTCNLMGKPKRTARSIGRRAAIKKAYITLKAGHSIDVVEGL